MPCVATWPFPSLISLAQVLVLVRGDAARGACLPPPVRAAAGGARHTHPRQVQVLVVVVVMAASEEGIHSSGHVCLLSCMRVAWLTRYALVASAMTGAATGMASRREGGHVAKLTASNHSAAFTLGAAHAGISSPVTTRLECDSEVGCMHTCTTAASTSHAAFGACSCWHARWRCLLCPHAFVRHRHAWVRGRN